MNHRPKAGVSNLQRLAVALTENYKEINNGNFFFFFYIIIGLLWFWYSTFVKMAYTQKSICSSKLWFRQLTRDAISQSAERSVYKEVVVNVCDSHAFCIDISGQDNFL